MLQKAATTRTPRVSASSRSAGPAVKTVLVSGAAAGIGRALVVELIRRGYKTAGIDRDTLALKSLQLEFGREHFVWRTADVTDAQATAAEASELHDELGHIDLLIAAAGVAPYTPAAAFDPQAVAQVVNVNLLGVANLIAAVLPGMLERGRGHVAALSSLASYRGLPNMMGYSASKAGLNMLMDSLRRDVRDHGVTVTTICPGHTRSPSTKDRFVDDCLMPMEETVAQILYAVDRRLSFHAFPRRNVWELNLMRLLPTRLQDWLLERRIRQVTLPGGGAESLLPPR